MGHKCDGTADCEKVGCYTEAPGALTATLGGSQVPPALLRAMEDEQKLLSRDATVEPSVPSSTAPGGTKHDGDKLRFDLIPPYPLERVAEVYTIGAKKYDDRNWEKGISWGRIFAAMMRHAWAFWRGEALDPVDGQHHLASVAWCALTLLEYERTHPELDDRSENGGSPSC